MDFWDSMRRWGSLVSLVGAFSSVFCLLLVKKVSRRQGVVSAIFICAYAGIVLWDNRAQHKMNWTPNIRTDAEVVGTWSDGKETVVLYPDGTFSFSPLPSAKKGRWTLEGSKLCLGANRTGEYRFVRYDGEFRLMTHSSDPDGWDCRYLGLARVADPKTEHDAIPAVARP